MSATTLNIHNEITIAAIRKEKYCHVKEIKMSAVFKNKIECNARFLFVKYPSAKFEDTQCRNRFLSFPSFLFALRCLSPLIP